MSARVGEWELFGLSGDPLPGDPGAVIFEVNRYERVADEVRSQIASLRAISGAGGCVRGEFVSGLVETASGIADDLAKIQGRFDVVAEQLGRWEPELAEGRRVTGNLLVQAVDARDRVAATAAAGGLPADASPDEVAADRRRAADHADAQGELGSLVARFHSVVESVRAFARGVADQIRDASHDGVRDSWADAHIRKWVHDHAALIKIIVKVLEIGAIVVAGAAFVCMTGGFGLFGLAGVSEGFLAGMAALAPTLDLIGGVLSVGLLVGHGAEMFGEIGSGWLDLGLDVFAVATFGLGKTLTGFGKLATRLGAAEDSKWTIGMAGKASKNALSVGTSTAKDVVGPDAAARLNRIPGMRDGLVVSGGKGVNGWAARAADAARGRVGAAAAAKPGLGELQLIGDRSLAATFTGLRALRDSFPVSGEIVRAGLRWEPWVGRSNILARVDGALSSEIQVGEWVTGGW